MSVASRAGAWRAGILAAGWGERLRTGGLPPKPLVEVNGQPLIDHVLGSLAEVSPAEVVVIVNEQFVDVRDHVESRTWPFPVRWIVESTPSSMHSFLRVVEALAADGREGPFLVSTVDTIAAPGAFAAFAAASRAFDADLTLAVRPPGDDEKPLLVRVAADGVRIEALGSVVARPAGQGQGAARQTVFETAGYYAVRSSVLGAADEARRAGVPALRVFLARLLEQGFRLTAVPVEGGVDVDRVGDVRAAEVFLRQGGGA